MSEAPNTVHGRLLEAVHISGYSFERACSELEWLLEEERWQQIGGGYDDINAFLATIDFSEFRIAIDQRKKLAKRIKDIEGSQRATAKVLGVSHQTVGRDLGSGPDGPPESTRATDRAKEEGTSGPDGPPEWFQDDVDPAEESKNKAAKNRRTGERERQNANIGKNAAPLPEGKYAAIYADPPWTFQVWSGEGKDRAAENHYPTMEQAEIEALPIEGLAGDDCALFLWAVMPQLPEALSLIRAWGFEYKTCAFTWAKTTKDGEKWATGMGYWTRANAELCLLATRGSPQRLNADVPQLISTPRGKHSAKPNEVAARIERLVTGPYIELFARKAREGWDAWGNEAAA